MIVFQLIRHEYNSDDGHYDRESVDNNVHRHLSVVLAERDRLNVESITEHNTQVTNEITRRWAEWEKNGKVEPPVRNHRGTQYYDTYSTKGIFEYEKKYFFRGDPTDLDVIERFTGRFTCLTYYTYDTLVVI